MPGAVFQTVLLLWGKDTGGVKTPGYSKTVLRTEAQRLRRVLSMCSGFLSNCIRLIVCGLNWCSRALRNLIAFIGQA